MTTFRSESIGWENRTAADRPPFSFAWWQGSSAEIVAQAPQIGFVQRLFGTRHRQCGLAGSGRAERGITEPASAARLFEAVT